MNDLLLTTRIGILMTIATLSPAASTWLNERPTSQDERGDITAQNAIWIAIAAAGAFVIAIILYNKFQTKANAVDMNNPGPLPTP